MRGVAPAGVLGLARVVAADAPREVLRGVACDEHGDARRARAGEGLTGDGACVGIDDEGGHGILSYVEMSIDSLPLGSMMPCR